MSFETDMIAMYSAWIGDRMWWDELPEGTTPAQRAEPFIILQKIGGPRRQYADDAEQPSHLQARVQVEVWGARRIAVADTIRNFIAYALTTNTANWGVRVLGEPMDDANTTLGLRGTRVDFMFVYPNPNHQ